MRTSYFANLKHIMFPLSISGKAPAWYGGPQCKILAPKYDTFIAFKNGEIDEDGYTKEYFDLVLKPLNAHDIYHMLIKEYGEDVVLLCYEKKDEFCHRRLVAGWFEESLGVEVPELTFPFYQSPLLRFE